MVYFEYRNFYFWRDEMIEEIDSLMKYLKQHTTEIAFICKHVLNRNALSPERKSLDFLLERGLQGKYPNVY